MRASKTDCNQRGIVDTFRKAEAFVQDLHGVAHGCPDLLICHRGRWWPVEIKDKRGKLTPDQVLWHRQAHEIGHGAVPIIRSCLEAVKFLNDPVKFMETN